MGLRDTIIGAVAKAFSSLGDVVEDATYLASTASSTYDPTTGLSVRSETSYGLPGVFLDYRKQEIDGAQIKPHDQHCLFQQASLAVKPTLQDRILRSDGKYWEIISVSEDPAHATWDVQIRGTNG